MATEALYGLHLCNTLHAVIGWFQPDLVRQRAQGELSVNAGFLFEAMNFLLLQTLAGADVDVINQLLDKGLDSEAPTFLCVRLDLLLPLPLLCCSAGHVATPTGDPRFSWAP